MYLSKLELVGFKSFAHKTVLRFDDGITAIVGPNGCGKSNLIDALRWAIGEQKASVLRSDRMENVIFNGAGKRRPLGMSEVSLTVENTRGILPTEYSEVTITRRLFRNGDSEYLLNKVQCRLRDIVDLFMDTGMGANAYSVIELKMIETILSDRADERRRLFEEAAGVTKYKHRRREALRRLDQTRSDLTRVNDIVKEVAKKVGQLERQAERARAFTELDAGRIRLEIELLERDYTATMHRIGPLEHNLAEARSRKDELDGQLAREEAVIQELEREHGDIDIALIEAQKDVTTIGGRIAQLERERAVAEERRRSLLNAVDRAERDIAEAQGGLEALARDRGDVDQALEAIRQQISETEWSHQELTRLVAEAEGMVAATRAKAKASQDKVIAVINALGDLRGEEERARARIDSIKGRLEGFDEEDDEACSERDAATLLLDESERELAEAVRALDQAQVLFEDGQSRKNDVRRRIDALRDLAQVHKNAIQTRESKIEFLTGLVDQDEAVRYLFEAGDWDGVEAMTVGDLLSVGDDYRSAIAAALGPAAHYLVVPSSEQALGGMRSLARGQKGKATFVCLDRVPSPSPLTLPDGLDAIGWACDLTGSSPEYGALRWYLLYNTLVVRTVDAAWAAVHAGVEQVVTLDGTLLRSDGLLRGGGNEGGTVIGKREQIDRLRAEVAELNAIVAGIEHEISDLTAEHESITLGDLSYAIRDAQQQVGAVERRRSQYEFEIESANALLASHEEDRTHFQGEIESLEAILGGIEPRRLTLREEQDECERFARDVGYELEHHERDLSERSRRLNESEVSLASLRGEDRSARSELERIRRDREKAEKTIESRRIEREEWSHELDRVDDELRESLERVDAFRIDLIDAQKKLDDIVAQQAAKREEIARHSERVREERRGYESALTLTHELEMKIAELTMKAEAMVERGAAEFEIDLKIRESDQDDTVAVMGSLREELRSVRDRLKMIGTVNLLAYDEWREENDRLTFLRGQVEDLRGAEKSLVDTIDEINDTAQTRFQETFEAIRANFRDIFTSLFLEGDEADIRLGEGDPLETQIEIIAKPRGKRPHSIDLLSGGEKTLTAIALLFAIYLVKPSPFCILDEVDAPLDDANIDRFISLVRRFVGQTQFIIVTHNKRTMAAADSMYGVTQEEDGVSKIVSVRFADRARSSTTSEDVDAPMQSAA